MQTPPTAFSLSRVGMYACVVMPLPLKVGGGRGYTVLLLSVHQFVHLTIGIVYMFCPPKLAPLTV